MFRDQPLRSATDTPPPNHPHTTAASTESPRSIDFDRPRRRDRRQLWLLALTGALGAATLWTLAQVTTPADAEPGPANHPAGPAPTQPREPRPAAGKPGSGGDTGQTEGIEESFAQLLERLVRLDVTGSPGRDAQLEAVKHTILHRTVDPANATVAVLVNLMAEDTTLAGRRRRAHCLDLLTRVLHQRHADCLHMGNRQPLNDLVQDILVRIPLDEMLAIDFTRVLADRPYLDVTHESALLDLATIANRDQDLVPQVVRLLRTLWSNLHRTGARSSRELAHLAQLFRRDGNAVKRLAAMNHLLSAADGAYRDSVLREVEANRDTRLAQVLIETAADELEPGAARTAILCLARVAGVAPEPYLRRVGRRGR